MVVLVDEYTASAAEIIAGALQDNGIPLVGMLLLARLQSSICRIK